MLAPVSVQAPVPTLMMPWVSVMAPLNCSLVLRPPTVQRAAWPPLAPALRAMVAVVSPDNSPIGIMGLPVTRLYT